MEIRKAKFKDLNSILDLYGQLDRFHKKNLPSVFKEIKKEFRWRSSSELLCKSNYVFIVAEEKCEILGFCVGFIKSLKHHPILIEKKFLHINDIVIDENYRSSGIGTELLNYMENVATKLNLDYMELDVFDFNSAKKFYEQLGFGTISRSMRKYL